MTYWYRHRRTGEIVLSDSKIDDPEFEYLGESRVTVFGGRRAISRTDTRTVEKEEETDTQRADEGAVRRAEDTEGQGAGPQDTEEA